MSEEDIQFDPPPCLYIFMAHCLARLDLPAFQIRRFSLPKLREVHQHGKLNHLANIIHPGDFPKEASVSLTVKSAAMPDHMGSLETNDLAFRDFDSQMDGSMDDTSPLAMTDSNNPFLHDSDVAHPLKVHKPGRRTQAPTLISYNSPPNSELSDVFEDATANAIVPTAANGAPMAPTRASPAPAPLKSPSPALEMPQSVTSSDPKIAAQQASDMRNIVRRKLTGYVGFANLPNQWHRKSVRKGFNFNVMVVGKFILCLPAFNSCLTFLGESGLGKSTLVNTLFNTSLYPPRERKGPSLDIIPKTVSIQSISADIEENGVRLRLTVVDTPGFGDFVNNDESWRPIVDNIEQRFDAYLDAENKVNRVNIVDNRIHACVYFIQPTGHALKPLDIEVMRRLHTKVNLIPVIAKSDTLTDEEIINFKARVCIFSNH
jgi:GTP-binding protein EngB required for normal cell division